MTHQPIPVTIQGVLGQAQADSAENRLAEFVVDAESEPLALFLPEQRAAHHAGDWYGEHVGKWLVSAARAAKRTGDPAWPKRVETVLGVLAGCQEPDGYLGTYAPDAKSRFTHPEATANRTWDLWIHAWLMLGLIECAGLPGLPDVSKTAARRIGDLILATFDQDPGAVVRQGNHAGLSSLVVLEPLAKLTRLVEDRRYAEFSLRLLEAANDRGLTFLKQPTVDVALIGTGKIYQILWVLQGIVELGVTLERQDLIDTAFRHWRSVKDQHLTPFGGPWGGIATHKEVFNPAGYFHPGGLVETCSSATWLALTQELFLLTGDAELAEEVERTTLNAILGAMDENGRDWCYFTFPNGRRNNTYHWACCKSSGALALESCSKTVLTACSGRMWVNHWVPFEANLPDGGHLAVDVGADHLRLTASKPTDLTVRVPSWAKIDPIDSNRIVSVTATPEGAVIRFEMPPRVLVHTYTLDHHGQEIVREDYACIARGPFVYATARFDGYATHQTLRLPRLNPSSVLEVVDSEVILLREAGRKPIRFEPFYKAGGRHDGAWRTTWLEVAWQ